MRLWSLESYKCLEEYAVPDNVSLVDFDFDESKVVWNWLLFFIFSFTVHFYSTEYDE